MERGKRKIGTLSDFQVMSDEAVIETDDGLTHIIPVDEIEQRLERLPETDYPSFTDAGIRR